MKSYNFGEKETEYSSKHNDYIPVIKLPKYNQAKKKAVELLRSDEFKGVLEESDFWILMNATKSNKMAYSGLIISHNGCLKINDKLSKEKRFRPECVAIEKDGYGGSLVFIYCCEDQGIFEVGEVSRENLKNNFPYAMALKRCFDRVVLKNSRLAYSGIISDSEIDDEKPERKKENKPRRDPDLHYGDEFLALCDKYGLNISQYAKKYKVSSKSTQDDFFNAYIELKKELEG